MAGGGGGAEGESVGGRHSGGGRGGGRYRRGSARGHHHHALGSDERHRGEDAYGAVEERRAIEAHEKSDTKFRQYRDSSRSFNEDSRISKQLRKLAREDDVERYMAQVQQLQESIMLNENVKYVRRHYDYILDSLYECLHAAPSPPCRWEITCCIGRVGHVMEEDVKRYVDLALERLDKWRSPEMKVLVLRCLLETLKLDGAGTVVKQVGCEFVEGLQGVLEITEAPEVMVATVDILRELHEHDSDVLKDYFQDIVDILVGWHIDYAQPPEVTRYVSAALLSFTQLWAVNTSFATTLLSQFVEDMVDDIEEHQRKIGDQIGYEESFNPSICARKVSTFIRVFTTVLQCLAPQADPLVNIGLTENFLAESFTKMVTGAKELMEYHKEETLLEALNQTALVLMSQAQSVPELQNQFCKVLELQHPLAGHLGFSATLSYLNLATQTLRQIGGSLSPDFIHKLVGPESPLRKLRLSTYRPVWQGVVTVYHAILSLKNVPLLQEAYKYILADLQLAQKALIPESKEFASTSLLEGLKYTEQEAPVLVMYYMTVLAEVANTRNSIITMWALNPPLVDLLAVHLSPTSAHLSLHYPEVQYAVLYLLYSHSCKHSHYISSSSLVVGSSSFVPPSAMSPPFSTGPPGLSGSSASENLATILTTITCILKQKSMVGSNILCLCVKWAADVVRNAESSLQQLMEKKLFLHMIEMLIMVGYHHKTSVTAEVALSLTSMLNVMSPQQLHNLSKVISLCLHHMSNIDADVRNQYMTLLALMPLSCVAFSLFDGCGPDDSEYSSNKQNESSSPLEFGSLDGSSLTTLERHHVLRSTAGHLPSNAFHTIMAFILHASQPKGDRWQEDLFTMCQRVDRMAKLEDWTFPVLASNLRTLLWKWLAWEPAQHCIINKLRTSLGKPQDTFTTIEGSLKSRAKEVREGIHEKSFPSHHAKVVKLEEDVVGDDKAEEHLEGRKEEADCAAHKEENNNGKVQILAVNLLVEFLESLEKAMFNASDGCAVAVPPPNKSVRMFFRTNRSTCVEWLSRVRAASVIVALNCGRPEVAVRHAYKLLHEFKENGNTQGADFERAVCYCVRALTALGSGEAVAGVYYWCRDKINRRFSWIKPAIYAAGNRYEKALAGYLHFIEGGDKGGIDDLEMSGEDKDESAEAGSSSDQSYIQQMDVFDQKHLDPLVQEFLNAQIAECYSKLSKWSDLQDWVQRIKERSKDSDVGPNPSGSMNIFHDLSHIQALSKFTSGDFMGAQASLEHGVKNTDWDKYSEWMVYAQLQKINSALLYTMATLVTSHSRNRAELNEIVDNVGQQLDWLMQTSVISSNVDLQARLLLLHQVVHEISLTCALQLRNIGTSPHVQKTSIFQYQNMVCDGLQASSLQGGWDGFDLLPLPADFVPQVSRWVKVMAPINPSITGDSIIRLDMLSAKQARKQENLHFAEGMLMSLFGSMGKSLTDAIPIVPAGSDFNILQASMHKEAAKLLFCQDNVVQGCETMAGIVEGLQPSIEQLYKNNPSQLHEPSNKVGDIAARALLSLGKWWVVEDRRSLMLGRPVSPGATIESTPEWMNKLMEVYNAMKGYVPEELIDMVDVSHPALPVQEGKMGNMLTLAVIQNPMLPKAWYVVASWCFRWGRRIIDYSGNQSHLSEEDKAGVLEILSPVLCPDGSSEAKLEEMYVLLGGSRGHEGLDAEDEDLRLEEIPGSQQMSTQVTNLLTSWGVAGTVSSELVPKLVNVYIRSQRRLYLVLRSAAKAYFKFLQISHICSSKRGDLSIVATLRLLRLIIKHASELQDVLETGMAETPTTPWKTIIPQLFARLNHPEPYVRGSVSDLLCRLAQDYPHLIIFPAVVGSTGGNVTSNQASLTDMLAKYIEKKRKRRKDKQDIAVEEEDGEFLPDDDDDDDDNVNDDSDEDEEQADEEEEEEEEPEVLDQTTEDQERHTLMRNCYSALVDTLTKQVGSSISGVQMLVHELRRITVLWDELWVGTLAQHHSDLSRKSHQLNIEIARLNNNQSLTEQEKNCLIKKKYDIIFKPLLFVLEQLADITSTNAETPHEKHFQEMYEEQIVMALQSLRQPENHFDPHASLSQLKNLYQMLQQRANKRASTSLKMADVSPNLAALKDTMIAMPGVVSSSNQIVTIASVDSTITILPTKTKPKKLSFQGSDGKKYTYLFKGLEDLHLDERIMQFLEIVNTMLAKNQKSGGSLYRARYYSVIPLGPKSGLIQWVGSATPLFGLYKRWQQREAQAQLLKAHSSTTSMHSQAPQVPRPSELFYSKLSPRLREEQISVDHRKEWPLHILRDVLKDLIKETPSDLLARELWMCSTNAGEWWKLTRTYSVSTAVMSIIGYIIGLGDRHLDNVLVNLTSGEVVHIDYNVCFEKGKNLRVPEKVPYRMTQNIETALGVTGVEGIFRSACEQVLRTMRRGRETLLTLLEAFVYDPLVDWTPDSEGGYAGAVYGGDQALVSEARQNRQQLERGLTLSMFSVRVAEMKADWVLNKTEVLNAVPRVKTSLELWASVHQVLCKEDGQLQDGHHLMALLKEAEANPQHPLYGLRPRFEEYSIVKKSLEKAKDLLNSRISETKNWHDSYKVASSILQGGQMNEWRTKIAVTGNLLASFRPVLEFLTKAGQAPLAAQCEHTEVELHKAVGQVHTVATSAMDLLTKYGTIWSHYPYDHLEKHRVSQQLAWLTSLSQTLSISSVQAVIAKSHQESADAATINYACTTDMQLHKKSSHLNSTLQKTYDRMRSDGLNDAVGIVNGVQGTAAGLSTIAAEVGGIAALTCAFLNSLTQLSGVRLRADKSASGAGEGLVEMTVSGLWWLGECSVTLGCILELVTLLARYSPPASPLETAITHAISVLHDVFGALHELILNTNGIIIVEGLRLLWRSESSVVNIVSALQDVLTAVPTPPHELVTKLQSHLRHTILLMSSPHEGAVQEAMTLHNRLTEVISHLTTNTAPQDNMNQGQMLLMGFHLLFENVDSQLDKLVSALMNGVLPQPWRRVDTIKEAAEVMGPLQDPALCEVVRAMLRVKKVQTMIEFFTTAYQFCPAVKIKSSSGGSNNGSSGSGVYEEDKLLRIVRRYASDCVLLLLFGLPTHLSSHLLLLHAQKMGVNVTGYIEARDVGTECRVSVEGIVQEALERCFHLNSLDPSLMTRASTAVNLHLAAIRKKLLLRHWEGEVEGMRASLQRVTVQHHSHQWYYEDLLKQHVMAPPIQPKIEKKWLIPPARGGLLGDLRTNVSTMVALHQNVTELHEKYSTLTTNVQQRLKWGAGSNPSIAQALEEFTTGVEVGLASVSDLLRMSTEIVSVCNSILHYEALRTQTVDALKFDASFTSLLNTCQESCMLTERYPVSVSPQEEMLITLCPLTGDLDTQWVQQASNAVSDHIERLTKQVKEKGNAVNSAAEGVKMAVISLRSHLSTHHKLISDVRTLLKSMAKYEGTGINGVEDYLTLYRNYSESMTSLIRQLLHDPLMPQKIPVYIQTLQHVSKQTGIIYDQLLDFGNRCVTEEKVEEQCGGQTSSTGDARASRPPLQRQLSLVMSSPVPAVSGSPDYKPKVKRHPVTGKVVQEHNVYALSVWRRVKVKLEGHDPDPSRKATVHEQVDYTIREATNHDNLATLYEGWTPWV